MVIITLRNKEPIWCSFIWVKKKVNDVRPVAESVKASGSMVRVVSSSPARNQSLRIEISEVGNSKVNEKYTSIKRKINVAGFSQVIEICKL